MLATSSETDSTICGYIYMLLAAKKKNFKKRKRKLKDSLEFCLIIRMLFINFRNPRSLWCIWHKSANWENFTSVLLHNP